ncbi:MAG: hypothetical protein V3R57_05750 [Candidatus Bathyarchaeia archaeon]
MTTTIDALTVIAAFHLGPTLLGRLAKRHSSVIVVIAAKALNGNQGQFEHRIFP